MVSKEKKGGGGVAGVYMYFAAYTIHVVMSYAHIQKHASKATIACP